MCLYLVNRTGRTLERTSAGVQVHERVSIQEYQYLTPCFFAWSNDIILCNVIVIESGTSEQYYTLPLVIKGAQQSEGPMMTSVSSEPKNIIPGASIPSQIERIIDALVQSLPDAERLSADQRRGIIARYTAVLEGNFIYWMTGAYLSAKSEEALSVILENLHEEVRDSHPAMLRRFSLAARAIPTEADVMAVHRPLTDVRLFIGRLAPVRVILMMAFFEGFIQRFMDFLERLAVAQGSVEREYTQVHGVCDITHTKELFRAVTAEMELSPSDTATDLFEGVDLLCGLIGAILGAEHRNELALAGASTGSANG